MLIWGRVTFFSCTPLAFCFLKRVQKMGLWSQNVNLSCQSLAIIPVRMSARAITKAAALTGGLRSSHIMKERNRAKTRGREILFLLEYMCAFKMCSYAPWVSVSTHKCFYYTLACSARYSNLRLDFSLAAVGVVSSACL